MFCDALVRVLVIYLRRLVPESFRHFFFADIISLKTLDIAVFRLRQAAPSSISCESYVPVMYALAHLDKTGLSRCASV
jgi:hypothetical protein